MTAPTQPRCRRWALTLTTTVDAGITTTTAVASYWTLRRASRALHRRNCIYPNAAYAVTPMDWAPYRHRATAIAAQLRTGAQSILGLYNRTALSRVCIEHTLLRMARDGRVTHHTDDPNNPRRGVWKLRTPQPHTTAGEQP